MSLVSLWPHPQDGSAASTEVSRPSAPAERRHEGPAASHAAASAFWHDAGSPSATSAPLRTPSV